MSNEQLIDITQDQAMQTRQFDPPAGPLPLNAAKYREYVEGFDLSEEQQAELLQTLWSIMCAFVDIGFGVDSVQRCIPALAELTAAASGNEVENTYAETFNDTAIIEQRGETQHDG